MVPPFDVILDKYKDIYENIVTTAYAAYCSSGIHKDTPGYCRALYRNITLLGLDDSVVIALEDVCQQVLITWWKSYQSWYKHRPAVSLRKHLIYMSLRDLVQWLDKESRIPSAGESPEQGSYQLEVDESPYKDFKLDLVFLLKGTHIQPFSILNSYERHLLYLKYREEKNIDEIARLLQRDKHSIVKHLDMVIEKLKELP